MFVHLSCTAHKFIEPTIIEYFECFITKPFEILLFVHCRTLLKIFFNIFGLYIKLKSVNYKLSHNNQRPDSTRHNSDKLLKKTTKKNSPFSNQLPVLVLQLYNSIQIINF